MEGGGPHAEGRRLAGRYRLLWPLGRGGAATVWAARDELLNVDRAVKLLTVEPGARAAGLRQRLRAEARAMAGLRHAHILRVVDLGQDGAQDFVVMELAPRGALSDRLAAEGPLPLPELLRVGVQLCGALAAAHAAGVVHRDVKPQNLLLSAEDDVQLADFGIALLRGDGEQRLTRAGVAMGSLAYMAPEQRQDAAAVGPAADIYAAGATLYALATNENPIDLFLAGPGAPRWLGVPPALRPALLRATRLDPAERHPSAAALGAELAALLPQATGEAPGGWLSGLGAGLGGGTTMPAAGWDATADPAGLRASTTDPMGAERTDVRPVAAWDPARQRTEGGLLWLDPAAAQGASGLSTPAGEEGGPAPGAAAGARTAGEAQAGVQAADRGGSAASAGAFADPAEGDEAPREARAPDGARSAAPGAAQPADRGPRGRLPVAAGLVAAGAFGALVALLAQRAPEGGEGPPPLAPAATALPIAPEQGPGADPAPAPPGVEAAAPTPAAAPLPDPAPPPDPAPAAEAAQPRPAPRARPAARVDGGHAAGEGGSGSETAGGEPMGSWLLSFGGRPAELRLRRGGPGLVGELTVRQGQRAVRNAVEGAWEPAGRALRLRDTEQVADAGRYELTLSADGARLDGRFVRADTGDITRVRGWRPE